MILVELDVNLPDDLARETGTGTQLDLDSKQVTN